MSYSNISLYNLIIAGVGGQGTIMASDIIGKAAVKVGLPVRAAETHGMAQRGGDVVNHLRIGCKLGSLIPSGKADAILALEPSEVLRYISYLNSKSIIILNTATVLPVTVTSGNSSYPDVSEIILYLQNKFELKAFDALKLAQQAGNIQSMNTVMIGAISKYLPIPLDILIECVKSSVPKKTIEVNIKAFELGRKEVL